jgi:hypothetical protein
MNGLAMIVTARCACIAGVLAALVAAVVAPAAGAHGSFPGHDPGRVSCATGAVSGLPQVEASVPDQFLGTRPASERVAFRAKLYRWDGTVWALERTGAWAYTTSSSGGNPVGSPLAYADGQGNRVSAETFSPLGHGHYAVLIQFWWSSTNQIHNMWANEYRGSRAYLTYCTL